MDFTTTIYNSTEQDNFFSMAGNAFSISDQQLTAFMSQLLSTIDLNLLGSVYFHQLIQYLPLMNLNLEECGLPRVYGESGKSDSNISVKMSLPICLMNNAAGPINVHYTFCHRLGQQARLLLCELHRLFSQQLSHALEFARLKNLATKDSLTALGNRNGFYETSQRLISRADRIQQKFALLVVDLDNFKHVNDTLGHQEGDRVLIEVAGQLNTVLRGEDAAFRIGGDEFCCLLECQDNAQLAAVAGRLNNQIQHCEFLRQRGISCSIGATLFASGDSISHLFDRADTALYQAKQAGKNTFQVV